MAGNLALGSIGARLGKSGLDTYIPKLFDPTPENLAPYGRGSLDYYNILARGKDFSGANAYVANQMLTYGGQAISPPELDAADKFLRAHPEFGTFKEAWANAPLNVNFETSPAIQEAANLAWSTPPKSTGPGQTPFWLLDDYGNPPKVSNLTTSPAPIPATSRQLPAYDMPKVQVQRGVPELKKFWSLISS